MIESDCAHSQVYNCELEDVPEFKGLTDFCDTFRLQRGKNDNGDDDPTVVGEFKVGVNHHRCGVMCRQNVLLMCCAVLLIH